MPFDPLPKQELLIEGTRYQIAEHPAAPGIAFGQEGRAAIVYKLETERQPYALKVFKPRFRLPTLAPLADQLAPFASLIGLTVCRRIVLTPQRHGKLLRDYPDLTYSVLMPWIEGPTWLQIIQGCLEITQDQSLLLARTLAEILAELEQKGIAHCDLSAANLILPALAEKDQINTYAPIELVDVEQLYASDLKRPAAVPSGSEGYAHLSVRQGVWEDKSDRFAGAVLLAEFLGWSDPEVRKAAWGESYFAPQEMQRSCTRFDLLYHSLAKHWGNGIAQLFANAWNSELLADCPTFGEWMVAIPDAPNPEEDFTEQDTVDSHPIACSEQMVAHNNVPELVGNDSLSDCEIEEAVIGQVTQLEEKPVETAIVESSGEVSSGNDISNASSEPEKISCPCCQNMISIYAKVCPYCETVFSGDGNGADAFPEIKEEEPTVPAKEPEEKTEVVLRVCQKCNTPIPSGNLICENCGHSIAEPVSTTEKRSLSQSTIWLFVFLGVISLVIYLGVRNSQTQVSTPAPINATAVAGAQAEPTNTIAPFSDPTSTIVPTSTQTSTITFTPTFTPTDIPLSSLPELAFFSYRDGNDNIYLFNSYGTGLFRLTSGLDFEKSPLWSPDGTKIVYSDTVDLWIMKADGSDARKLTNDGFEKYPGGFTPDGKLLIFENVFATRGIYSLDLENNQTTLIRSEGRSPAVSPDGTKIAYWYFDGYYVMNIDGSDAKVISRDIIQRRGKSIAWSPDGTHLACVSADDNIKLYNLNGSEVSNLTNGQGLNFSPDFSPDGKYLSFTSDRSGDNEIYVLNLASGVTTRVTHNIQNDEGAVWRPTVISSNDNDSKTKPFSTETPIVLTDPLLFLGQPEARFVDPIGGAKIELVDGSTKLRFSVPNYRRDLNPETNLQAPRLIIKSSQGMETKVQTRFQSNGFQAAGLLSWISQGNFIWFGPSSSGLCGGTFINSRSAGNAECLYINTDTVGLRIERDDNTFNLSYSIEDGIWFPFDTISFYSVPEKISSGLFLINQWEDIPYSADFFYFKNLP